MHKIKPINYKICLEPNLEKFTFNGTLELILESKDMMDRIELNALELDIQTCRMEHDGHFFDCDVTADPDAELLRIVWRKKFQGRFAVRIAYTGRINDKMAGFYRSQYVYDEKSYPLAVTQFQESDARRAFPCLDQPAQKAVFDIEIIIDKHLSAISNQDMAAETMLENGKKKIIFKQSPKMSTYLVFWCVGEFSMIRDKDDPRVRIVFLPGMEAYIGFGLDFGKKALAYCEDYYGIAYPLSKLDLIAIPDFAFGAMENWGAITFRENLLLFYPGITSKAGAERIAEVIAHEMAHQWFGNLVTPADWKYLWLNESFATYFGFGVVDHYHPDWETWPQFLYSQTHPALVRDAYLETIPIEIPGGEHVVINTSTAPIIYCKGGSILRQIKGYIGDAAFKDGVRFFLERFQYGCAASQDLWEAFASVSEQPVQQMMQTWIEQPGYPVLEAQRSGNTVTISQKRFSYQPNTSSQVWQIPLSIHVLKDGEKWHSIDVLMNQKKQAVDLGSENAVYKINARQTGFYRVNYLDADNRDALGRAVRNKTLPPEDRWGLENDLYAQVMTRAETLENYLNFLKYYENETHFLPLKSIAENLLHAYLLSGTRNQQAIQQTGILLIDSLFAKIAFVPQSKESHTIGTLRDQYIWLGVFWGSEKVTVFARAEFEKLLKNDVIHPDILKSILQAGAFFGGMETFHWLIRRIKTSASEHERTQILSALGCFTDHEVISAVQSFTLNHVPARNQSIPVTAMSVNPLAATRLWEWYTREKAAFAKFHPLIHERVFSSIVPACHTLAPETVRNFLLENYIKINPDVVNLTLERLAINDGLKQHFSA